jgi:hypothetical protein
MFDLNIGIRVTFSYFKSGEGHHSHVLKLFSERVKKEDALVHGNTPNLFLKASMLGNASRK